MQVEIFEIRTYWTEQNLGQKFNWRFQFPHIMVFEHMLVKFGDLTKKNKNVCSFRQSCFVHLGKAAKMSKSEKFQNSLRGKVE